jgi:hypothetical protein
MPRSSAVVPSKPQQASVTGNVPLTRSRPLRLVAIASASVVARCGFRPQVEFGSISLNLPPDSKDAEPGQGEQ